MPTALQKLLHTYREGSQTEREKGGYFEKLVKTYLLHEPAYRDLFGGKVWLWEEWRQEWQRRGNADPGTDAGIDLVAIQDVDDSPDIYAIQAKFYSEGARISKKDMDSFLSSMGRQPFTNGLLFVTSTEASQHAQRVVQNRDKPVNIIDLTDLEHSQIDWSQYQPDIVPTLRARKKLRPHQTEAVSKVIDGLRDADRGKLIMACGTGKTFTSLKIAEEMAGKGGRVLFLVPSLALLSQTLTEWTQESQTPLHSFAVCSDSDVGKRKPSSSKVNSDDVQMLMHELRYPATTKPDMLAREVQKRHDDQHISVIYGTYHSIEVIGAAQKKHGLPPFDLIVCDEAHRTTGSTWAGEEESHFVKVHDANFIKAAKRLYMTATPRIFGVSAKQKEEAGDVALFSMDEEKHYGKELHVTSFSEAVNRDLLCDYKVIVLTIGEAHVSHRLQNLFKDENNSLKVDDAGRIIGCWKALAKLGMSEDTEGDPEPMRRAVAFCQVIEAQHKGKGYKVSSKQIAGMFREVVDTYQQAELEAGANHRTLACEAAHIDGTMNASQKEEKINWLKDETPDNTCRILSNVRCLSEGVDVPTLDAVLFLSPRNSQVEVVQSVGRVMRKAPGKQRGYVILPVVVPEDVEPNKALDDNKTYRVVWEVLQALRSHDDRFDAHINKLDINGQMRSKMEVIAISDDVDPKGSPKTPGTPRGARSGHTIGEELQDPNQIREQAVIEFKVSELERALYAKIVKKCGNRLHWEQWAGDIAKIAQTHITRISAIVGDEGNKKEVKAFNAFAEELRDDLNDSITDEEVIEMLAQHLITKPVFDALFEGYSFAANNPVSQAMQKVLNVLQEHHLEKEADTLEQFYESVRMRAEGINNAEGKQKIMVELYDKFFRNAFPRMTERLGIVYTPVEVVDFIIHSVNDLLQQEFSQTLGCKNVHIIDPFTGTGTFISRLLQSGLISKDELPHKYQNEIHANEIVLLAYYIAAINIESAYHAVMNEGAKKSADKGTGKGKGVSKAVAEDRRKMAAEGVGLYRPFEGICLTDTFQMYEKDDLISELMVDNSERRKKQKGLDIRVIMGNPPYSVGQGSQNDNNQNISYSGLDEQINKTYAAQSRAALSKGLYDSYIRAIRWASDRLCKNRHNPDVDFATSECAERCRCAGVIGYVTNAGFVEASSADGLRKCLVEEFSSIYVFHLRGNTRTSGEIARKEGGQTFGSGSRAPIAISFLVKNPEAGKHGQIFFHDIGDYLTRDQKLEIISGYSSIQGIARDRDRGKGWKSIMPDKHGDWLNQRDNSFYKHITLGSKKAALKSGDSELRLFDNFSLGIVTNRDAWCYNYSQKKVDKNMCRMIEFYNSELDRFNKQYGELNTKSRSPHVNNFINTDPEQISWTRALKQYLAKGHKLNHDKHCLTKSLYRPFSKQRVYFNRHLNEVISQMPRIFPEGDKSKNLVIIIKNRWYKQGHLALITNYISSLQPDGGDQCFPLYLYESPDNEPISSDENSDLFVQQSNSSKSSNSLARKSTQDGGSYTHKDGITDEGLQHFQAAYPNETITKEDIFYYVYGLLHSPEYRGQYADNLSKELPRIPCVKTADGFRAFSQAGRDLAHWHLNYETVDLHPATLETSGTSTAAKADNLAISDSGMKPKEIEARYRVTKMKHPKAKNAEGKSVNDLTTVIYNDHITVKDIPEEAYEYVVNGKPAIEWVIERQCVKTDKASGIVNDANDWAIETMDNPRYPLELLLRIITVSLETNKIVSTLPPLEINDG